MSIESLFDASQTLDFPYDDKSSKHSRLKNSWQTKKEDMRRLSPNSYLMPGFDPSQISNLLEAQFSGEGSSIEQAGLYLNPSSAARWCSVSNQADYLEAQAGAPYRDIAQHIARYYLEGIKDFSILALGSGDGRNETRLTQHLLTHIHPIDLLLLDISQPLLKVAYDHATSTLGPQFRAHVFPVLGNMLHLAQGPYVELYTPQPKDSRRLITMLGYTLGNLSHEQSFIADSLGGFAKGDLLLVDVQQAVAPAEKPAEVKKLDPSLSGKPSPGSNAAMEEFLANNIHNYCRGVVGIEFFKELDSSSCVIPGSYAVVMRAKVHFHDGREKTFTVKNWKRYEITQMVTAFEKLGWMGSTGWTYGQNRLMYLFEKAK